MMNFTTFMCRSQHKTTTGGGGGFKGGAAPLQRWVRLGQLVFFFHSLCQLRDIAEWGSGHPLNPVFPVGPFHGRRGWSGASDSDLERLLLQLCFLTFNFPSSRRA
jgi:hypothetical protein